MKVVMTAFLVVMVSGPRTHGFLTQVTKIGALRSEMKDYIQLAKVIGYDNMTLELQQDVFDSLRDLTTSEMARVLRLPRGTLQERRRRYDVNWKPGVAGRPVGSTNWPVVGDGNGRVRKIDEDGYGPSAEDREARRQEEKG